MTRTLSIRELAIALGVGESTVRRLIREGAITHAHVGRQVRVGEAQLDAYLAGEASTQVCEACRPLAAPLRKVAS